MFEQLVAILPVTDNETALAVCGMVCHMLSPLFPDVDWSTDPHREDGYAEDVYLFSSPSCGRRMWSLGPAGEGWEFLSWLDCRDTKLAWAPTLRTAAERGLAVLLGVDPDGSLHEATKPLLASRRLRGRETKQGVAPAPKALRQGVRKVISSSVGGREVTIEPAS